MEGLLSKVEQSPPESILDTLPSFVKALIDDELITHSDEEIKVVVASCISEITRITAPDAPYEDQQMKVWLIWSFYLFWSCYLLAFSNFFISPSSGCFPFDRIVL